MARIDDIDSEAAVRKYLERKVVGDREDEAADSADEITAILEATALAFLLYPQAALTFILRAKNVLQQILDADVEMLDFLLAAVDDVQNPNEPINDTSDLIEAQTALVAVDRIGRISSEVQAYDRYTSAVTRFLDRQLASSLKRRRRSEFERSGSEAKQDLFRVLSAYLPSHEVAAARLATLASSVSDFGTVDLTRIVSTKTVSRVRASLKKILTNLNRGQISKTTVAVELLSGAAALRSVSSGRDVFDPLVDTGEFPEGRTITAFSELVQAEAVGTDATVVLPTPGTFNFTRDWVAGGANVSESATLPTTLYLSSKRADDSLPFVIPASNNTLYVQLDGIAPPVGEQLFVKKVVLTAGTWNAAQIATQIHAGLQPEASCSEWNGSGRLLITASGPVTKITVRDMYIGTFDIGFNYIAPDGSIHETVGFVAGKESESLNSFSPSALLDILDAYVSGVEFELVDEKLVIRSETTAIYSSLRFTGATAAAFGFAGDHVAQPGYLVLKERNVEVDPTSLGIVEGSVVSVVDQLDTFRSLRAPVASFDGTHLLFDTLTIPRTSGNNVIVITPLVEAVQSLMSTLRPYVGTFGSDGTALERVLVPLLSQPSLAQINDASAVISAIRTRVDALRTAMGNLVVRQDRNEYISVVDNIVQGLEDRGLDRALDLLLEGRFSGFFGLTNETASKSSRLMKAAEELANGFLRVPNTDENTPDLRPTGSTDDDILRGDNLSSDEDIL